MAQSPPKTPPPPSIPHDPSRPTVSTPLPPFPSPALPPPPASPSSLFPSTKVPKTTSSPSSEHLPAARLGFGSVSDPHSDFYQMLGIDTRASIAEVDEALRAGVRWWNAQQANPKYRHLAPEALARLREARETLLDPMRRQSYDRSLQAFRHAHREARWQPIRDLMDVLFLKPPATIAQEDLLIRYAQKRGIDDEEIERLLQEEFLRRALTRPLRLPPNALPQHPPHIRFGYRVAIGTISLTAAGIVAMSLFDLSRPAILLMLPLLNNLRLLVRGLSLPERTHKDQPNAWDWLAGITVLGGSTVAALADAWRSMLFPLGASVSFLVWLAWLHLTLLWQKTPMRPTDPLDPFNDG